MQHRSLKLLWMFKKKYKILLVFSLTLLLSPSSPSLSSDLVFACLCLCPTLSVPHSLAPQLSNCSTATPTPTQVDTSTLWPCCKPAFQLTETGLFGFFSYKKIFAATDSFPLLWVFACKHTEGRSLCFLKPLPLTIPKLSSTSCTFRHSSPSSPSLQSRRNVRQKRAPHKQTCRSRQKQRHLQKKPFHFT